MAKDDFNVVAYKVLAYLYACLKAGAVPSEAEAREVAKVNEVYFYAVVSSLSSNGLVEPVKEFRDMNGDIIGLSGRLCITMAGAEYLEQNATMKRIARFLGKAFEAVIAEAVKVTLAL